MHTIIINNNSPNIIKKMYTHSLHGFAFYAQNIFLNGYSSTCSILNVVMLSLFPLLYIVSTYIM